MSINKRIRLVKSSITDSNSICMVSQILELDLYYLVFVILANQNDDDTSVFSLLCGSSLLGID